MSTGQRIALLAAAVVIAAVAFVLLKPDDEEKKTETPAASTQTAPERTATATAPSEPAQPTGPEPVRIRVVDGKPVGGVEEIEVDKGDRVDITVSSEDTGGEVHVHGVDLSEDLEPGKSVRFRFKAKVDGIFEIELEETATQIAELRVAP